LLRDGASGTLLPGRDPSRESDQRAGRQGPPPRHDPRCVAAACSTERARRCDRRRL